MTQTSAEWRSLLAREYGRRGIGRRYWFNRLAGWAIPSGMRRRAVETNYDGIWGDWANTDFAKLTDPLQAQMPHQWRGEGLMLNTAATQKLHLALLTKAVRLLKPKTVLEVGSGWGLNLVVLACQCPQTRFRGVELTRNGIELSRSLARADALPEQMLQLMPGPPLDSRGHQRIELDRGSAERLPYEDGSFDLVFTRLALEQMESIRDAALSEISRVARHHVVMIESFRELNDEGMRRQYALANHYFRGAIAELPRYGLKPIFTFSDWPHKVTLQPAFVLVQKSGPGAVADAALEGR